MSFLHFIPLKENMKPLLISMKLFGLYHERSPVLLKVLPMEGKPDLTGDKKYEYGNRKLFRFFSGRTYCGLIVILLMLNVLRYIPSFWWGFEFVPNLTVFRVIVFVWYIECAVNSIIMFVACEKKDHFSEFIDHYNQLISDDIAQSLNHNPRCMTIRLYVRINTALAWFVVIFNTVSVSYLVMSPVAPSYEVVITNPFFPVSIIPRSAFILLQLITSAAWVFPVFFKTTIFLALKTQFRSFALANKKLIKDDSVKALHKVKEMRYKHLQLCKAIEILEKDIKYLIFNCFSTKLFLMCFTLYQVINSDNEDTLTMVIESSWFFVNAASIMLVSTMAASVHEAAHFPLEDIYDICANGVTQEEHTQLNLYLSKLTGTTIGFSVMGLVTVTKEVLLTLVGLYLTYFFLLLQFKIK